MTAVERLVHAFLESDDPSEPQDFDAREMIRRLPVEWEVNFVKRTARPWEQAIYVVTAPDETSAIEKGWEKLKVMSPKRWQMFRVYSVRRPKKSSQLFGEAQEGPDDFDARQFIHDMPDLSDEITALLGKPAAGPIEGEGGQAKRWNGKWPIKGGVAKYNIFLVYTGAGEIEMSEWTLLVKPTGKLFRVFETSFAGNYWAAFDEFKMALERLRRGDPPFAVLQNWKQWMAHNRRVAEAEDE